MEFSDCVIEPKKNWRGNEQVENIEGFEAKKYGVNCNLAVSVNKRQVLIDKELKTIKNFEEYFKYSLRDSHKSHVLEDKYERRSVKKIKASVWGSQNFPMKIADLMPLLDLLSTVSQKARRFHELLNSTQLFQSIGFPIRAKIPLMFTITASVAFQNLKLGDIDDSEFNFASDFINKAIIESECKNPMNSSNEEIEEESEIIIGPKLTMIPTPALNYEE